MRDPVPDVETRCFASYVAGVVGQYYCPQGTFASHSQMEMTTPVPQGNLGNSVGLLVICRCWRQSGGFSMMPLGYLWLPISGYLARSLNRHLLPLSETVWMKLPQNLVVVSLPLLPFVRQGLGLPSGRECG